MRATFHLPHALVEEARNATVALSGPPTRLTLARLVEDTASNHTELADEIRGEIRLLARTIALARAQAPEPEQPTDG